MSLSLTGGLIYHLRAAGSARSRWAPFRAEIARWLGRWNPRERSLLLIGPSAGYCLPRELLRRFDRVDAVDPDRLAALLLPVRARRRIGWSFSRALGPAQGEFRPELLPDLFARYPRHAVLFCNVLGQLRFVDERAAEHPSFALWKRGLERALEGRSWASFHDRLSGPRPPRLDGGLRQLARAPSDAELIAAFYPDAPGPLALLDHLTGDLWPAHPREYFGWELAPGEFHLVEAIQSQPPA